MLRLPTSLPTAVPWINWNEWIQVKQWLYESDRRIDALRRLNTWRSRGKLPVAVECTAALLECDTMTSCTDMQKRHTYAMIIVRLVNGVVDREQTGLHAKSVTDLAKSVGLPRILVDIRHDATHNDLPSLELLRMGIDMTRVWLKESYWEQQHSHFSTIANELRSALRQYKGVVRSLDDDDGIEDAAKALLRNVTAAVSPASEAVRAFLIPMLLEPMEKLVIKLPKRPNHVNVYKKIDVIFKQCRSVWLRPLALFGKRLHLFLSSFLLAAARRLVAQSSMVDAPPIEWECALLMNWIKELLHTQFPFMTAADTINVPGSDDDDDDDDGDGMDRVCSSIEDLPVIAREILHMCLLAPNHWTASLALVALDIVLATCNIEIYGKAQHTLKSLLNYHIRPPSAVRVKPAATHAAAAAAVVNTPSSSSGNDGAIEALLEKLEDFHDEIGRRNMAKRQKMNHDNHSVGWRAVENWEPLPIGTWVQRRQFSGQIQDVTDEFVVGSHTHMHSYMGE